MATLDELEAAATAARQAYEAERDKLAELERSAVSAIRNHAEVQIRVLTGAGVDSDADDAAAAADERVKALRELAKVLVPDRGRPPKVDLPVGEPVPAEEPVGRLP